MELKEQISNLKDELSKSIVVALESKNYRTAKQLMQCFDIVHSIYLPGTYTPGNYRSHMDLKNTQNDFSITSNSDVISFGGTDSVISLGLD
jgi:hypothetical protein